MKKRRWIPLALIMLWLTSCLAGPELIPVPVVTVTTQPGGATATLKGKVTVGPLTPVEQVPAAGETATPIPAQVYTSRSVDIYQADGITLVKKVHFSGDGTYQTNLAPGIYVVSLPPGSSVEFSKDLPKTITLHAGEVLELDIAIDTGIR